MQMLNTANRIGSMEGCKFYCIQSAHMIHEILTVGPLHCNCSIFGDEATKEASVIDPGDEIADIVEILDRHQLRAKAIVITHAHIDHVGGSARCDTLAQGPAHMSVHDQ